MAACSTVEEANVADARTMEHLELFQCSKNKYIRLLSGLSVQSSEKTWLFGVNSMITVQDDLSSYLCTRNLNIQTFYGLSYPGNQNRLF